MKVSRGFMSDFDYLTELYRWNAEDVAEMKDWVRSKPDETMPYISNLAAQWRKAEGIA